MNKIIVTLALVWGMLWPAAVLGEADLIVINANVLTMDPRQPRAKGFSIVHRRFLVVGEADRVHQSRGQTTQVLDLEGLTVVPGFNDAHLHPRPVYDPDSVYASVELGPEHVKSIDELVAALQKKAAITPKGQWLLGSRYQDTKLGRHPTRFDLDRASMEHPISISHSSGHVGAVNSLVLRNAGIGRETADPPGGAFDRDQNGEPNGVVRESARGATRKGNPPTPVAPFDDQLKGILKCFEQYAAKGITSVGVAGAGPDQLRLFQAAREAGNPVRISMMFSQANLKAASEIGLKTGFGDEHLRIVGIKMFHGNSLSGRTCWLHEPYDDRPDYFGIPPARSQEALDKLVAEIHDAGFQAAIHSNGDREIAMVLTAIERAQSANPRRDPRHRIEHASVMNRRLLERAKALGVILVFHSYMWEHGDKLESYGPQRLAMMHPHRTALDMGIHLAGHSDHPVSAADAMLRVGDMVTRRGSNNKVYGPEQRVTPEEAIRVFTLGGAFASFEEDVKGSIAPGNLADFVVLSEDPTKVEPEAIRTIKVVKTFIDGRQVYPIQR